MTEQSNAFWTDHAIWWHAYPLGFVGANVHGGERDGHVFHRLGHLEAWLDYIIAMGGSGLQLGPVFASSYHGYDTVDYFRIDPRLGDDHDFDHLVAEAKRRGLRVLLDGVFNHVGQEYPAFQKVLAEGPSCPEADLFRLTWPADWKPGDEPGYADFEGHGSLVALNHRSPAVADLVANAMAHWLRRGIDGWRLDAAYSMDPTFWERVIPRVRAEFPDAWFVGEVIHGDYEQLVGKDRLDSVTQYELWKATWSSLVDKNFFELEHALRRHNTLLDATLPMTFIGNHDVTRIATKVGSDDLAAIAVVVFLTVGGIPSIYYGDEQGYRGTKYDRLGGDDEVRPVFPSTPAELAPYGAWMYRLHQDLIGIRRRHPWLVHGRVEKLQLTNEHFRYAVTNPYGEGRITVDLDISGQARATIRAHGETVFDLAGRVPSTAKPDRAPRRHP